MRDSDWRDDHIVSATHLCQFFQSLAAIINDEFFATLPNCAFELDLTARGWIHLIIGVLFLLDAVLGVWRWQ